MLFRSHPEIRDFVRKVGAVDDDNNNEILRMDYFIIIWTTQTVKHHNLLFVAHLTQPSPRKSRLALNGLNVQFHFLSAPLFDSLGGYAQSEFEGKLPNFCSIISTVVPKDGVLRTLLNVQNCCQRQLRI